MCMQASYQEAEAKLAEERATLSRYDNELKDLDTTIKTKKQAILDTDLQLKQLEHDINTNTKEKQQLTNAATNLEKQNEWIQDEKGYALCAGSSVDTYLSNSSLFGRPNTPYDFTGVDVHSLREKARELENQQKSMKKKVNPKAMNMIDR